MKKVLFTAVCLILAIACIAGCSTAQKAVDRAQEVADKAVDAAQDVIGTAVDNAQEVADEAVNSAAADESLKYIQDNGKLIMGLDDSFPPMGYKDDTGEIVGFDVDLAKEVAKRLGVELVCQPIDWKAKELELNNKNIDVIWNGFTITDERKETLLMSDPYMKNQQIVVVLSDSDIAAVADLSGKKVAVQDGSSAQEALAADEKLLSSIEQIDFKDNVTAFMDLSSGQVDALAVDSVVADYYLAQNDKDGKFKILDETLAPEEYGIGFRKEDIAFEQAVQGAIDDMKDDGTFAEISGKWFGRDVSADL